MIKNTLTTKEVSFVGELLSAEQLACKKTRLYARILTDKALAEELDKIADNHERRFMELYDLL